MAPSAEADQCGGGSVAGTDPVQQATPASQRPGAGQLPDRLLHQGAQAGLVAVVGALSVGQPVAQPVRRRRQGGAGRRHAGQGRQPWQPGRATAARGDPGAEARAGRGDRAATDLAEGLGVPRPGPFADLEALRAAAELPVARFAALAGIPERTYHRRLATLRSGDAPVKGPWPTPAVDAAEALAAKYAADWPAWGHRKIAAMMRADGHQASTSTVERALRRRGLLLPRGFRADRKSWAALRRKVFHDPPTERNRVWQTDFSEFETAPVCPAGTRVLGENRAGCPLTP